MTQSEQLKNVGYWMGSTVWEELHEAILIQRLTYKKMHKVEESEE